MAKKNKALDHLDLYANLFEYRDWDFTSKTNLKSIRYTKGNDEPNALRYRIKHACFWMFGKTPEWYAQLQEKNTLAKRFGMAKYSLKRDPNLPDGILDSGNIITFWYETGEYLNLMQPTVGSLLVKFLKEEPENPHAILITKEIERLYRRRNKRIKDGETE